MRRLWHLAPFLVLFGALLASFPSNAEDVFSFNETLIDVKKSSLLKDAEEFDASPLLDSQVFPPSRTPIRFPPPQIPRIPVSGKHLL